VLVCSECGRRSEERATGWHTHLGADDIDEIAEDEEPRRILAFVFCPECAEREFREGRSSSRHRRPGKPS
jgi:hypothetical protein